LTPLLSHSLHKYALSVRQYNKAWNLVKLLTLLKKRELKARVVRYFQRSIHLLDKTQVWTTDFVSINCIMWSRTESSNSLSLSLGPSLSFPLHLFFFFWHHNQLLYFSFFYWYLNKETLEKQNTSQSHICFNLKEINNFSTHLHFYSTNNHFNSWKCKTILQYYVKIRKFKLYWGSD